MCAALCATANHHRRCILSKYITRLRCTSRPRVSEKYWIVKSTFLSWQTGFGKFVWIEHCIDNVPAPCGGIEHTSDVIEICSWRVIQLLPSFKSLLYDHQVLGGGPVARLGLVSGLGHRLVNSPIYELPGSLSDGVLGDYSGTR